jgi:O-antigen ligase/cytochrome c-type biogenesis protein CcmH/NrfG
VPHTSLIVDRWVVAATVVLTAMLFTRDAVDPVNVLKLTVLTLGALLLAGTAISRAIRHRVAAVPIGAGPAAALLLAVAFLASTVAAPTTTPALLGAYGRNSGLLAYICSLILYFTVVRTCLRGGLHVIVAGLGGAGLLVASYGMLQWLGIDAIPWNNPFNPIISALGNPNFAAAYMGITAPVAAGAALWPGWPRGYRAAAAATAVLCVVTALLSDAAQGPLAASGGLGVVVAARLLDLTGRARRAGLGALALVTVGSVALIGLGATLRSGPLAGLFTGISYDARLYYWDAALQMLRDRPVFGVGLDHYGSYWRTARSAQAVAQLGGESYTDSAHSVPLQMLAQGGLVLGLTYGGFVLVTGFFLVRGLVRLRGQERLLLAMLGGSWVAYQVQSLVSIDQVPLIVLHFVTAGGVIAAGRGARLKEVRLPGALPPPPDARAKRRAAALEPRTRDVTPADLALLTVTTVVLLALAWQAVAPLRANVAVQDGVQLTRLGNGTEAYQAYERASDLVPGLPYPWVRQAELFAGASPPQSAQAREAYLQAASTDPRDPNVRRAAAMHAEATGDLELARQLLHEAVTLDPNNPETVVAAATFQLRHGGAEAARRLLEDTIGRLEKVTRVPAYAPLWATLGDARAVLGDAVGARTAYQVAVFLEPGQEVAERGLEQLDEQA